MPENSSSILDIPLSRRKLLKTAAGAGGGALAGYVLGNAIMNGEARKVVSKFESKIDEVASNDIQHYRKALGYKSQLPIVEKASVLPNPSVERFSNSLPEELEEYGNTISDVLDATLGKRAPSFVKTVKVGEDAPSGLFFRTNSERSCNISAYLPMPPHSEDFMDIVLHEAVGHGSDPDLTDGIYTLQELFQAELGRWKMVAQAFSVPGEFLNHESDLMAPYIERELGAAMAWVIRTKDFRDIESNEGTLHEIVKKIAQEEGKPPEELKYNKRISRRLGEIIFPLVRKGTFTLSDPLQKKYEEKMDVAMREMYAEMMKMALFHHEKLKGNTAILDGCKEILSVIQGSEVDLDDIRSRLTEIKNQPVAATEKRDLAKNTSQFLVDTSHQQNMETILDDENSFRTFSSGVLPESADPVVADFSFAYSKVVQQYPELSETYAVHVNDTFDPDLDIWDIHEIEDAMDSAYVRELNRKLSSGDTTIDKTEVQKKSQVLLSFINSSAFTGSSSQTINPFSHLP